MPDSNLDFLVAADDALRALLEKARTLAVVGLSSNPARPSHGVARYLQSHGYRVVPVNPRETEVLGEPAYPDLGSAPGPIDVVVVFRRPEDAPQVADQAIAAGTPVLWLQDGVVSPEAALRAHEAGLTVVMDDCIRRRHRRLLG
jgi:predicted CoA-binding protein